MNRSTGIQLRPIQDLIKESEASQTTESADTYTDPVDDLWSDDNDTTLHQVHHQVHTTTKFTTK